jgi:hypothetical protein
MRLPSTFAEWQAYSRKVHAMAERINAMRSARGWAISRAAGIGRCGCSLHNCSIDVQRKGWAAGPGGWARIAAARQALKLIDDYSMYRLYRRISRRAWEHYMNSPLGDSPRIDSRQRQLSFT